MSLTQLLASLPTAQTTRLDSMLGLLVSAENASNAGIPGPVFKHCTPPDRSGLRTASLPGSWSSDQHDREGWDAQCIAGHFNIFRCVWTEPVWISV